MSLSQEELCSCYIVEFDPHAFYKEIEIRFYDCDASHRAKPETLLRYTADIAGIAYTSKGYSHKWLWDNGFVFLLSRASVAVTRMPLADESVLLETWEREVKGVLFYRDVVFYSSTGELLVSCSTAWSLVDPTARVIRKPSSFATVGKIDPHPQNRKASCEEAERLKEDGILSPCGYREIVYSDIDGNGHVYNAVYAGITCDVLPKGLTSQPLVTLQINFKQEVLLGERLTLFSEVLGDEALVIGKRGDAVSYICHVKVTSEQQ